MLTASCRARQDAPIASASLPGMLFRISCRTGSGRASRRHGSSCADSAQRSPSVYERG